MKVLVIGGGGREHAIVWKLSQSLHVDKIYCCPGNAGIAEIAECIDVELYNFDALIDFVKYEWIDLTIVGPEDLLSRGIVDLFEKEGLRVLGPNKDAARVGISRVFAKDFMRLHRIPTAEYKVFTSYLYAEDYLRLKGTPIVIKADRPADNSTFIALTIEEAIETLRVIMKEGVLGELGKRVILEKRLEGEEVSFMIVTDGKTISPLSVAKNYKSVFDGNRSPNTEGMGAYSPVPYITRKLENLIIGRIMGPTVKAFNSEGMRYKGVLSADIILHNDNPYVLELNCTFEDPETQAVFPRLRTDLLDISLAITEERLSDIHNAITWEQSCSVCVVATSEGYPSTYLPGLVISGLKKVKTMKDVIVFHAGTTYNDSEVVTSGGRVLAVTATGAGMKKARAEVYKALEEIYFEGIHFRKDIGEKI
jgi:phosphoribosylamine--glycine ligase